MFGQVERQLFTSWSFTNTPLHNAPTSLIIFKESSDAFGDFTFAASSAKNIPLGVDVIIFDRVFNVSFSIKSTIFLPSYQWI